MSKYHFVRSAGLGLTALGCLLLASPQVLAQTPGTPGTNMSEVAVLNLQEQINEAIARKQPLLKVPPGTYKIASTRLDINNASGLTIDGTGSTWLFSSPSGNALNVRRCKDLTLKGFTIDYDALPFTQATITSVSPDNTSAEFQVHEGYPRLTPAFAVNHVHVFEPKSRLWKTAAPDIYANKVEILTPGTGRLQLKASQAALKPLAVGDMIVLNIRNGGAISIRASESTRVEDVTVLAAPGIGVIARFVSGDNYFRFKVARGPRPAGATEDRLFSANADAFNYAYARKGPVLEKCDFAWMGDDSVNLHGVTLPVLRVESPTVFWTARPNGAEDFGEVIKSGDAIRLLAPRNFAIKGELTLQSWEPGQPDHQMTPEEIRRFWAASAGDRLTLYKVTLAQPGTVTVGDWFDIPAIAAPHFTIRDSYFHDHRARGLRLMASHGMVTGNRLERIKQAAVTLGPGYAFWRESGWVEDIEFSGNTVRDVATDPMMYTAESATPGAIGILAQRETSEVPYAAFNRNLRLLNNTISGANVAGIHINGAQDVLVKGNTISGAHTVDTTATGSKIGLSANYAISVNNSSQVRMEENTIRDSGKYQKGPIQPGS